MKKILFFSFILITYLPVLAQNVSDFEGIIKYDVSFEKSGLPTEALDLFKNAEVKQYISPNKCRMDMNMVMQNITTITDLKEQTSVSIMDVAGKKYLIKMDKEQVKKARESKWDAKITYSTETKIIAGYLCKKGEALIEDKLGTVPEGTVMDFYYTEEIPVNEIDAVYKGVKGFLLEYSMDMGGMRVTFVANSVNKQKVDQNMFDTSNPEYIETTMEALQKELMKQMIGE